MNEEDLRKKFEQYIKQNGIKVRFIANVLNVNESLLCHWRKKRRNLSKINYEKLQNYINDKFEISTNALIWWEKVPILALKGTNNIIVH